MITGIIIGIIILILVLSGIYLTFKILFPLKYCEICRGRLPRFNRIKKLGMHPWCMVINAIKHRVYTNQKAIAKANIDTANALNGVKILCGHIDQLQYDFSEHRNDGFLHAVYSTIKVPQGPSRIVEGTATPFPNYDYKTYDIKITEEESE